jgi:hypothetical protein
LAHNDGESLMVTIDERLRELAGETHARLDPSPELLGRIESATTDRPGWQQRYRPALLTAAAVVAAVAIVVGSASLEHDGSSGRVATQPTAPGVTVRPSTPPRTSAPTRGGLRDRLIDPSVVPAGFVPNETHPGLVNAPGQLDTVGRIWSRPISSGTRPATAPPTTGPSGSEDSISLSLTRFPTSAQAVDFNAGFANEYGASDQGTRSEAIAGIPGGVAYVNNPTTATAWFTIGSVAVSVYVTDHTENALTVAEGLAYAQYHILQSGGIG